MLAELSIFAVIFAIVAVVYIKILAFEDVLNWWFKFGLKYENKWFHKPIWGCHLCFSGQLALWSYLANWVTGGKGVFSDFIFFFFPKYGFGEFSVFWLVYSITLTILASFAVGKLYDIINKIK